MGNPIHPRGLGIGRLISTIRRVLLMGRQNDGRQNHFLTTVVEKGALKAET